MRKLIALTLLSGCGSTLFAITPRSQPAIVEVSHVEPTYGGYPVVHRELHRRSTKTIVPALVGMMVDAVVTTALFASASGNGDAEAIMVAGLVGTAAVALDVHLISNRAIVDERLEAVAYQPGWPQGAIEMPSQAPGSGYSTVPPSFSIQVSGSCPATPSCTVPATRIVMPPPAPTPNTPVELVPAND